MKKHLPYIAIVLLCSCVRTGEINPYAGKLFDLNVELVYPKGYEEAAREGVNVDFEEINTSVKYTAQTLEDASVTASLPAGLYRISVSDRLDKSIFNGTIDRAQINGNKNLKLELVYSKAGTLVIKEIYCGGCSKDPEVGNYQSDQYIILHNNDTQVVYLDSLCFGALAPYNSNSTNPWGGIVDYVPVIQALWQFGGSGESFPLAPGEDAVLCLRGAIDHTVQYHLSVNLNKPGYFVCYNNVYFYNTAYHPAPGDQIQNDHILDVVEKVGQANAYTYSINSPATVIFRPEGISIREYVKQEGSIIQIPGSTVDRVVKIPWEWIMDGVEVFNGSTASNSKRLRSDVDAGYVSLSETFKGHSLIRRIDEQASAANGYEVLMDTNNSSEDMYERAKASLYVEKEAGNE